MDRLIWHYTPHGGFTVISAYTLGFQFCPEFHMSGSSSTSTEGWSLIWDMKIPPKVRHFMWRFCQRSLPCCANLIKHGVHRDMVCKRCRLGDEEETHVFFTCAYAKAIWRCVGIDPTIVHVPACLWLDYFHKVHDFETSDTGITARLVMNLWAL